MVVRLHSSRTMVRPSWGPDKRTDEEIPYCSRAFNRLPSSYSRISGEAEQNSGEHDKGILLEIHDRLGQISPKTGRAFNSTQHSTTGISPIMMLTGKERLMPLTFFYREYEWKKTSPQAYVKEAVRRQVEQNKLRRRITAQAHMRQLKKYDAKILQANPYAVGQNVWVFQNAIPQKGLRCY